MSKNFTARLSRRRLGQGILAGVAALVRRWLKPFSSGMVASARRGAAGHAPAEPAKVSMREAEFYEVERLLP